jgi:hypothetical protein
MEMNCLIIHLIFYSRPYFSKADDSCGSALASIGDINMDQMRQQRFPELKVSLLVISATCNIYAPLCPSVQIYISFYLLVG